MNPLLRFGILEFLQRETSALDRKLLVMTLASGTANALILAVINAGVESMRTAGRTGGTCRCSSCRSPCSPTLCVIYYTNPAGSRKRPSATCACDWRIRSAARTSSPWNPSAKPTSMPGSAAKRPPSGSRPGPLFSAAQSSIMVIFTLAYIAIVSPMAVLISVAMIVCGVAIYLKDRKSYEDGLQEASHCEDDLFTSLTRTSDGLQGTPHQPAEER